MDLAFDPASRTLLLLSSNEDHLVEIDPTAGDRTLLSDRDAGFGPEWLVPSTMALDANGGRVLVLDHAFPHTLYAVDRTTGVRTVLASDTVGTGILRSASSLHLDAPQDRALIVSESVTSASSPTAQVTVTAVDLATGDRTVLSDPFTGVGPNLVGPLGGAYDPVTQRIFVAENRLDAVYVYDTSKPMVFDRAILSR